MSFTNAELQVIADQIELAVNRGLKTALKEHREECSVVRIETFCFGSDTEAGAKVRLDRIEQREDNRRWLLRAILVAVIGLIISTVWTKATGG